jgi:hypothetical protein
MACPQTDSVAEPWTEPSLCRAVTSPIFQSFPPLLQGSGKIRGRSFNAALINDTMPRMPARPLVEFRATFQSQRPQLQRGFVRRASHT